MKLRMWLMWSCEFKTDEHGWRWTSVRFCMLCPPGSWDIRYIIKEFIFPTLQILTLAVCFRSSVVFKCEHSIDLQIPELIFLYPSAASSIKTSELVPLRTIHVPAISSASVSDTWFGLSFFYLPIHIYLCTISLKTIIPAFNSTFSASQMIFLFSYCRWVPYPVLCICNQRKIS